jgi:hypothetical protein
LGQAEPKQKMTRWEREPITEGEMDILLWVIVAIIVLAVVYGYLVGARKRNKAAVREGAKVAAPDAKGHGTDLQAVRKVHDDMT